MEIICLPCPTFLKMLNSCPSKEIDLFRMSEGDFFETVMVLLSVSPYIVCFLLVVSITLFQTTRGLLIFIMIFAQNFVVEFVKGAIREPRPNFKCNQQFGNPSNHATFYTSLCVWMIMEFFILQKKFRFSNTLVKLLLFTAYPFILYARVYLNYHSGEQISNGIILGIVIGVFWFIICDTVIMKKDNPLRRIMHKLRLKNTMSDDEFFDEGYQFENEPEVYRKLLELNKKQDELSKIKSQLKGFTDSVKSLEFLKNAGINVEESKKDK